MKIGAQISWQLLFNPDSIFSFHPDILELTYSHTSVYLSTSLWYSVNTAEVCDSTPKPPLIWQIEVLSKKNDKNTSIFFFWVFSLFSEMSEWIFGISYFQNSTRKSWMKTETSSSAPGFHEMSLNLWHESLNTSGVQCWAQENWPLQQNTITSTHNQSPVLGTGTKTNNIKTYIAAKQVWKSIATLSFPYY